MTRFAPTEPPPVERPRVNLLGAARTPTGETFDGQPVRWQQGVEFYTAASGQVALRGLAGCAPTDGVVLRAGCVASGTDTDCGLVRTTAAYAETVYECTLLGVRDGSFTDRAVETLNAELPRAVESELWHGTIAKLEATAAGAGATPNRYLTGPQVVDLTPAGSAATGVTPTAALGMLERALRARYSGTGIIHADAFGFAFLPWPSRTGGIIETRIGNRVVPGVGYDGTGPTGTTPPAGTSWVYITPMVTVRVGELEVPGGADVERVMVERRVNRLAVTARVPFTVDWDGIDAAFAVLMQTKVE